MWSVYYLAIASYSTLDRSKGPTSHYKIPRSCERIRMIYYLAIASYSTLDSSKGPTSHYKIPRSCERI